MTARKNTNNLLLKGTRTAMSFVAEARRLGISDPYPEIGQPGYSTMADVLSRCVLFANWEVVGAAALVRAGTVTRVVEMGLRAPFRTDEFMRRLTWRLVADAAHELGHTQYIEDAYREELDISGFVERRRANRAADSVAPPMPIGRIQIPRAPGLKPAAMANVAAMEDLMPRMPRSLSV